MRLLFLLALAAGARAQGPVFEVASVRPAANAGIKGMDIRRDDAGGIRMSNVNVRTMIVLAYMIQEHQLAGAPGWTESERYDVLAKAPAEARKNDTWPMLRALLEERFHLAVHRETREATIYELKVAKGGLKIQEAQRAKGPADDWCRQGKGHLQCFLIPLAELAFTLSGVFKQEVVDRTGIDGKFDLTLDWVPVEAEAAKDGPTISTALGEQLGLKLEAAKGPVKMLVVDHVEKASAN
jgi:uncharacterized protein (TIGR03435 family)